MGKDSSTRTSRLTDLPTPAVLRAKLCDCSREQTLLQRRLRLGQAALRTATRGGLIVRQIGRCRFVLGKDLISYLEQQDP